MTRIFTSYLAMTTRPAEAAQALVGSDLQDLGVAMQKLASHAVILGDHADALLIASIVLKWIAFLVAVYLLLLDRTNWRTNMMTALLVPYIFFTMPYLLYYVIRGEIGKWIALITVFVRLFYPSRFPEWFELPGAVILLIAVAPEFAAYNLRFLVGDIISLVIGSVLLWEHIKASGGFREAFKKGKGLSNTIGILLLFIYPLWTIVAAFII